MPRTPAQPTSARRVTMDVPFRGHPAVGGFAGVIGWPGHEGDSNPGSLAWASYRFRRCLQRNRVCRAPLRPSPLTLRPRTPQQLSHPRIVLRRNLRPDRPASARPPSAPPERRHLPPPLESPVGCCPSVPRTPHPQSVRVRPTPKQRRAHSTHCFPPPSAGSSAPRYPDRSGPLRHRRNRDPHRRSYTSVLQYAYPSPHTGGTPQSTNPNSENCCNPSRAAPSAWTMP